MYRIHEFFSVDSRDKLSSQVFSSPKHSDCPNKDTGKMKEKEKEKELNLGNPTNTSDQPITSRAHFYPGSARLFQSCYVLMIFTIPRVVFGRIRNHSLDTYRISYYFGGTSSFFFVAS